MEQGVESLIGGQTRRDAHHKLGVNDRKHREQARVAQAKLLVALLAGQDTARIDLGAGTRRGGHAHQRQRIVGDRQAERRAAIHKVPDVTGALVALGVRMRVGRHRANTLAAVHDRTAAKRQHKVAAMGARHPATCVDGLAQRIGLNAIEQLVRHAGTIELGLQTSQISKTLDRVAAGGNDERFDAGQLLRAQLTQLARAKQHLGRCDKRITVHTRSPYLYMCRVAAIIATAASDHAVCKTLSQQQ